MPLAVGDRLVPFSLPATDGTTVSTEQFADRAVLGVVFWCNHCPYVKAWEDRVIAIGREFSPQGVQLLLINSNDPAAYPDDSFEAMTARAREKAYPFPYLFDESQEIARSYGATRTPEVFLFDSHRKLCYHGAPDDNYENPNAVTAHYLRDAITALLSGRAVTTAATPPKGCTIKWRPARG